MSVFPPRNALVVCTQRIGDVLLATPLSRTLKQAWPDMHIDFLVLPGTEGVLQGNPDIDRVLAFRQRCNWREKITQLKTIWRRYDLAFAATPSDRARLFAWAAAARSFGFLTRERFSWSKRWLLDVALPFDNLDTHTVASNLQMVAPLDIPILPQVQPPAVNSMAWAERKTALGLDRLQRFAVLHPNPKFRYKMWTIPAWVGLAGKLADSGLHVVLTGSSDPEESAYVRTIGEQIGERCTCLAGKLSLAETTALLKDACLFVGPDTAVTHLAAATGIPTIALFGPSNPVKWGPWPAARNDLKSPWQFVGSHQHSGNVWLIQGKGECVPCLLEGCDRHLDSDSKCLQEIDVQQIWQAAQEALGNLLHI